MDNRMQLPDGVEITSKGIQFNQPIPFEEWESLGGLLVRCQDPQWVAGDWINYGTRTFGEEANNAIDSVKMIPGLRIASVVAAAFPHYRRVPELLWSHHDCARKVLVESEQDALLRRAVSEKLKLRDFIQLVKRHRHGTSQKQMTESSEDSARPKHDEHPRYSKSAEQRNPIVEQARKAVSEKLASKREYLSRTG